MPSRRSSRVSVRSRWSWQRPPHPTHDCCAPGGASMSSSSDERIAGRGARTRAALAGERALRRHHGHRPRARRRRPCPRVRRERARPAPASAWRRLVIVRLALLGGDAAVDDELRAALADLPGIALLAPAHSGDADILLAADSSLAAAGDLVRGERSRRADARVLLVAAAGSVAAGASGPRMRSGGCGRATAGRRRSAARARRGRLLRCVARHARMPTTRDTSHCLGAGGGMGTTTCAVALGPRHSTAPSCSISPWRWAMPRRWREQRWLIPDALLRIACGPVTTPAELGDRLAHGALPGAARARAPGARRSDRRARRRAHPRSRRGERPARDRRLWLPSRRRDGARYSSARGWVAIVASADARGARGASHARRSCSRGSGSQDTALGHRRHATSATRARRRRWQRRSDSRCSRP